MERYFNFFIEHFSAYLGIGFGILIPVTLFSIIIFLLFFRNRKNNKN